MYSVRICVIGSWNIENSKKNVWPQKFYLWTSHVPFFFFYFFFFQKVKFWGLIFQSGPRSWSRSFRKTTTLKFKKIQFLPFCHCALWSNRATCWNRTNSVYLIHRKRPGNKRKTLYLKFLDVFNSGLYVFYRKSMVQEQPMVFSTDYSFCIQTVRMYFQYFKMKKYFSTFLTFCPYQ